LWGNTPDYRLFVAFNDLSTTAPATNTTTVDKTRLDNKTTWLPMWVICGFGTYFEHDAPITVDITVLQPSSGYAYTTTVQGNLHEAMGQATHNEWRIEITGDLQCRVTSVSIIPVWTIQ
jgi:hypothetical protein